MSEPIFFPAGPGLSVAEIATLTGATPADGADLDRRVTGIAPPELAGPRDLVFLDRAKLGAGFQNTHSRVGLMAPAMARFAPAGMAVLHTASPYVAFVAVASALFPASLRPSSLHTASGVAPGAHIHVDARLEDGVTIDPGVVVGAGAEIGAGTILCANAVIGPGVRIGRDGVIGAGATLTNALVGDRVVIHPGVRIGQDGYGYLPGKSHRKVPQIGRVIIQDDVEIGANTTIDRGGIRDTFIGEGTKIDNLVQIGHNVRIGRHCIVVSQVGISGSSVVGDYAMIGGQAGLADHVEMGEGAQLAAHSGLMNSIPPGERWGGAPAMPLKDFFRATVAFRNAGRGARAKPGSGTDGEQE